MIGGKRTGVESSVSIRRSRMHLWLKKEGEEWRGAAGERRARVESSLQYMEKGVSEERVVWLK